MSSSLSAAEPVKILIAVRELGIGGSERQACLVARLLDPKLFDVTVGCFVPHGLRRAELDSAGIAVHDFGVRSFVSLGFPRLAMDARRWVSSKGIRLVHSFDYPTMLFFAAAFGWLKPVKLLSSLRSYRSLIPQPYRFLLQQAEMCSDRIVVNSDQVRQDLIRNEGISPDRLHLLYNAVDPCEFPIPMGDGRGRPRPRELTGASLVIGCVCGIRREKDLPTLMRAVAKIRQNFPELRLVLVGSGPADSEIAALRRELQIEEICMLVPQTAHTQPWLAAIDIFVLPSVSEAVSNALLEAMSSGCVPIASRIGGNVEIIDSEKNGYLFPAGDVAELARLLSLLASNEGLRKRLSDEARASVVNRFSPMAAVENLTALYRQTL